MNILDRLRRAFSGRRPAPCSTFLRWAEEALRDISERCEHAGTDAKCRTEVAQIAASYWKCKSNDKLRHGPSEPMTQLPDGSGCFTATIMSDAEAMALPLKDRPLSHRISSEMYHAVFEAIGEASMCWNPRPSGEVFASEEAADVAVRLCFKIAEELEKQRDSLAKRQAHLRVGGKEA